MNALQFLSDNLMNILAILGLTGTGILFVRSQRLLRASEAKSAKTAADLSEIGAYNTRIRQLADAFRMAQEENAKERAEAKEREQRLTEQLHAALELNIENGKLIEALKTKISELEQAREALIRENDGLRIMLETSRRRCQTQAATIAKMKKAQK